MVMGVPELDLTWNVKVLGTSLALQAVRSVGGSTVIVGGDIKVAEAVALFVRSHTSPVDKGSLACFTMMLADAVVAGQVYV
jgi:hypothetical protein